MAKEMLVPHTERDPPSFNLAFNCRHQIVIEIKILDIPRLGPARPPWGSTEATFRCLPSCFFSQVNPLSCAGVSLVELWEALLPGG